MAVLLQHELLELEGETFEVIDVAELSEQLASGWCSTSCCSCSTSSCCSCSCSCGSTTSTTSCSSGSTSSCA